MGSQSKVKKSDLAYIAGFLDGDGSLMMQIKKRKDSQKGWRFMFTICFYQDSRHEKPLFWIRNILGIGYISRRNDNITELRINGYKQIYEILKKLTPFIKFKQNQAEAIYDSINLLLKKQKLNKLGRKKLLNWILKVQSNNYVTKRKKTRLEFKKILDLTP